MRHRIAWPWPPRWHGPPHRGRRSRTKSLRRGACSSSLGSPGTRTGSWRRWGKRADPNATDANGNTSVHYAAGYDADMLRAMIARGGRYDARNSCGDTPFHTAAAQGYLPSDPGLESVRMLRSITK